MPLSAALMVLLLVACSAANALAWGEDGYFWGRATFYDDNTE